MKRPLLFMLLPLLALGTAARAQETQSSSPFKLILVDNQSKIQKGELKTSTLAKSWTLPDDGVKRSKKYNKLSSTLMPTLERVEAQVNAHQPQPAVLKNVGGQWIATDQTGWIFNRDGNKANIRKAIGGGQERGAGGLQARRAAAQRESAGIARCTLACSWRQEQLRGQPGFPREEFSSGYKQNSSVSFKQLLNQN